MTTASEKLVVLENVGGEPNCIALSSKPDRTFVPAGVFWQSFQITSPLRLVRAISKNTDAGPCWDASSLLCTATVANLCSLDVIGVEGARATILPLIVKRRVVIEPPTEPANEDHDQWYMCVGWYRDREHNRDGWYSELYLPPAVFDDLAARALAGRVVQIDIRCRLSFWMEAFDRYSPTGHDVAFYLRPGTNGSPDFPQLAVGEVEDFRWTEADIVLGRGKKGEEEGDDDPYPPTSPDPNSSPAASSDAAEALLAKAMAGSRGITRSLRWHTLAILTLAVVAALR